MDRPAAPDLQKLLGGSVLPEGFSRADRVRLLGECARALLRGELPSDEARLFVAGGLSAWLEQGGSLTRDFWRVSAVAGSHHTECYVWRSMCSSRGATDEDDVGMLSASFEDGDSDAQ
jgi:hypothetical protein